MKFDLNNGFHLVLGTAPSALKLGFSELDVNKQAAKNNLARMKAILANKRNLRQMNKQRRTHDYQLGDYVYVQRINREKTDSLREGPFRVVEKRALGNNLLVETPNKTFWTNVTRVIPCGRQDVVVNDYGIT